MIGLFYRPSKVMACRTLDEIEQINISHTRISPGFSCISRLATMGGVLQGLSTWNRALMQRDVVSLCVGSFLPCSRRCWTSSLASASALHCSLPHRLLRREICMRTCCEHMRCCKRHVSPRSTQPGRLLYDATLEPEVLQPGTHKPLLRVGMK